MARPSRLRIARFCPWALVASAALLPGVACSSDDSEAPDDANAANSARAEVTYHQDVKPILDAYCVGCHQAGGLAPFALTNFDEAKAAASLLPTSVQSRAMPPFLPAPATRALKFDTSLSDDAIATIVGWVDAGAVEGDSTTPGEPITLPRADLSRTDLTIAMPDAYTPTSGPDEYRCFVIPWPLEAPTYVTGFETLPGNLEIAHHAAAFLVDEEFAAIVDGADGEGGKTGYPCFGGAAPAGAENFPTKLLAAWTPGGGGIDFPEGTGIRVEPGARVILQMHYSILGGVPEPDLTAIDLKLDADVAKNAGNLPWLDVAWPSNPETMLIPAGEASVAHEYVGDPTQSPLLGEFTPGVNPDEGLMLHAVLPHMHKLGRAFWIDLERANGDVERLLNIERWDFDWQGYYIFEEPVLVEPGDQLRMRCEFDNSAQNQPTLDGMQRTPSNVTWGEGTYDEMCTASLYVNGIAEEDRTCEGSEPAENGRFQITFDTTDAIRSSGNVDGELIGPVSGSIYRAEDVALTGPKDGAEPVANFSFDGIDLRTGADGPHLVDVELPAGDYQFLGYMDTDGNAAETDGPDLNDPIMIPARATTLQCAVQPVTVNFPLLMPNL